jgi:hypothetical protein
MSMQKLNTHVDYVAVVQKQGAIARKLDELDNEERAILDKLRSGKSASDLDLADRLLAGGAIDSPEGRTRLAHIERERAVLKTAQVEEASVLERAVWRLSKLACDALRSKHRGIAADIAEQLGLIDNLVDKDIELRREIERAGYSSESLPSLHWDLIGRISDGDNAPLRRRINELRAYASSKSQSI